MGSGRGFAGALLASSIAFFTVSAVIFANFVALLVEPRCLANFVVNKVFFTAVGARVNVIVRVWA